MTTDIDALWDWSDYEASERAFAAALEGVDDLDLALQLRTQIARTYGLRADFDRAHETLDAIESELTDATPTARLRCLLERGRAHRSGGAPERGLPLFEQAWDLARELGDEPLALDAIHMVALAVGGLEARVEATERGIAYARECSDERARRWLGPLYNNVGWDYHEAGRYAEAYEAHLAGWEFRRARDPLAQGTRIARWSVGKQLRYLGRADEALALQRALLAEHAEHDPDGDGFVHEELGELLWETDRDAARAHYAAARPKLEALAWFVDGEPERLARLRERGA